MFENSPLVDLTVGRSSVRQRILALLMDSSGCRLHLREIQRRAGTSPGTASRELAKLVAAGLIEREAEGNQVYFRASGSPFATMLRSLLVAMPAPELQQRPPRLPRAKRAPFSEAPAEESSPTETAVSEPIAPEAAPATSEEAALDTASTTLGPTGHETGSESGTDGAYAAPRVIRPGPETQEWTALPLATETPAEVSTPAADTSAATAETPTATSTPAPTSAAAAPAPAAAPDPVGLQVATRLAESVRSVYGEAVRGIYLYGARASGPAPVDADVETIIVLDRVDRYGAELERTRHLCSTLSHELNLVATWNGGPDGVLPPVRAEAVAV